MIKYRIISSIKKDLLAGCFLVSEDCLNYVKFTFYLGGSAREKKSIICKFTLVYIGVFTAL
jgi:hypothetical protein